MKLEHAELCSEVLDIRTAESVGEGSFDLEFDVLPSDGYVLILMEVLAGTGDFRVQGFGEENSAAASQPARQRICILRPAEAVVRVVVGMSADADSKVRATIACFKRKIVDASGELSSPLNRALSKLLVSTTLAWMGIPSPDMRDGARSRTMLSVQQIRKLLTSASTAGSLQGEILSHIDPPTRATILTAVEDTAWLLDVRDRLYVAGGRPVDICPYIN